VMLYRFTGVLARSYPKPFTFRALCYSLYALALILGFIDFKAAPSVDVIAYQKYKKALPFGSFFIGPQPHLVKLSKPMADARNEAQTVKNLKDKKLAFDAKPNIFLFVIESLRRDFVTEAVAPNLYGFGSKNYSFPYTHANANCTHTSWHAIFHADVPVHWTEMQSTWSGGSIPLRALKDAGYKINLLCASNIETFQMDKLIFGHEHQLIDTIYQCKGNVPASECDRRAMKALERRIEPTGNVYIVFLDSTHAKYSVPPDYALKFEPSAKDVNYLHITPKTLDLIKNRYRNSISYVDSLFGPFFDGLKRRGLYDDSIIVITADHGEEFFEDGAMFHGMHLNEYQTSVPLFYKFQKNRWQSKGDSSTHMDIFPSILHYLTKQYEFANLFDGESIFMNNRWPYRVAVMQNGSFHPEDFRVTGEGKSYYFRYMETRDVSASQGIEVLTTPPTQESLPAVLGPLISH
jgi:membrane-anchored protein YejM (alkaline phosphatase superfamily)